MLVSFIIPSYNSTHTVVRCLDSIYALPLKSDEFEVIFIDDCSTDNTFDLVSSYQIEHPNITLLKQLQNNRQGAARNRGMKLAKGEYICFVDSDDVVAEGIVNAIRLAKKKEADMVALHYANANENGVITSEAEKLSFMKGQIFFGIEMQNRHPYWCSAPWGYIYSKEFLHRVNYPFAEDVLFEDSDFVATHLFYARRMAYSETLGYIMYYRDGSTTHSMTHKILADYLLLGTRMMALYERIVNDSVKCKVYGVEEKKFAEGILEGACFNVERSCRRLVKLGSVKEMRAYYERVDVHVNRKDVVGNKLFRKYYWNTWTGLCMKNKRFAIISLFLIRPIYILWKK